MGGNKNKPKGKKRYYLLLPAIAILLALGIVADILYPSYSQVVNNALGASATASGDYVTLALENSKDVNIRLEEEGAVLLKNEGGLLPLEDVKEVNVYGILSAHLYKGGSGSSSNNAEGVDLKTALESVGLQVNPELWALLESSELGYQTGAAVENGVAGQYELTLDTYENTVPFTAAKEYSPCAIVTFGTNGGEGSDGDRGDVNSLELGENEKTLLERLDSEGFQVIALINSSYVMELGPVIEHADAILWIGGTGLYGAYGVADILAGSANPSGRLVDTWMYEQETSSTYYTADSTEALYVDSEGKQIGSYSNYSEGIYVGYRWYETADAEGYWTDVSNEYGTGYAGVVAYPFGYGLSYTTFDEKITDAVQSGGEIAFTITASNTGAVADKDVIELYVQKPYTNGGVEVSQVELIGFAKTEVLDPGGEQTVTLTVKEEDLASYDSSANSGAGCYVLAGGEYAFYLASATSGAHCWSSHKGDAARCKSFSITRVEYSGDNKRSTDAVTAVNLLETADNDTGVASNDAMAGYQTLSRADGFANAAETISKEANTRGGTINGSVELDSGSTLYQALTANYGNNTHTNFNAGHLADVSEFTDPSVEQEKRYVLADLYTTGADGTALRQVDRNTGEVTVTGVDYDDPRWETLISQMSVAEMEELIGRGGYGTIAVESIEKLAATDYDGPTGFSNFLKASLDIEQDTTGFCSEPIMAATWNVELLEEYGLAVGMEGNAFGNNGWYAPGMNIHRTTFEGRTGEYFSEDPYITGMAAAAVAGGAFQNGVYTYAKHFAFNELEANRSNGMNCVMNEQTAREIYLRPFELAIKQGKLTGMMSSFMLMNAQWNGGNFNLMHGIVRTEWGFKGIINTDLAGSSIMGAERALCAGTDMLLATSYGQNARSAYLRCDTIKETDEGICAMKTAVKHILYAYASAALNRAVAVSEVDSSAVTALFIAINVIAYLGAAVLAGVFVWRFMQERKSAKIAVLDTRELGAELPSDPSKDKDGMQ